MSKKKKNEFLRGVKDRVEAIQDMDKHKKVMAGGVIGVVAIAAIIGVSLSGKSARSVATTTTAVVDSTTAAQRCRKDLCSLALWTMMSLPTTSVRLQRLPL